jgi:hypothetical protein
MTDFIVTNHADARLQQRGMKHKDIDLIKVYGEYVEDGILMTTKVTDEAISSLRRTVKRLEKLKGRLLITDGPVVITCFPATETQISRRIR